MDKIINFYNENKELIQLIAVALVWFFTHRQVAINYVKKKAGTLIFVAEKYSDSLVLNFGKEKMDFVVSQIYQKLPGWVRMFVSLTTVQTEAQKLVDAAKNLAESKTQTTTQTTTSTPAQIVTTTQPVVEQTTTQTTQA